MLTTSSISAIYIIFLYFPEIYLISHNLSLFLEGGGLGKTTLSLFEDVTFRPGGGRSKARVTTSLFLPFFLDGVP